MRAFPWFLLAAGIVMIIIGVILFALGQSRDSGRGFIDPSMRDEEIVKNLKRGPSILSYAVILIGFLCVIISIVWRSVLWAL